ncbi:hypothetical protein [Niabella soli]|uniref:Uncharacterized protein n=1 Tax=Niabella soli DSM 19437 TaxID=929713 RepID=W0F7G4_9BACT|nr:hypothetical protein [Niabella soli]AHF17743.1 hypothetical protein NIASO_13550 [Niabella soli DSM 19437]
MRANYQSKKIKDVRMGNRAPGTIRKLSLKDGKALAFSLIEQWSLTKAKVRLVQ